MPRTQFDVALVALNAYFTKSTKIAHYFRYVHTTGFVVFFSKNGSQACDWPSPKIEKKKKTRKKVSSLPSLARHFHVNPFHRKEKKNVCRNRRICHCHTDGFWWTVHLYSVQSIYIQFVNNNETICRMLNHLNYIVNSFFYALRLSIHLMASNSHEIRYLKTEKAH